MAKEFIQASFNSGEWAPNLWARTDLEKYHSGAALLENWFVDYRGGATVRSGTKYIIRAYKDSTAVRLIPFQAAVGLGYVLEFGDEYIRFHQRGFPILETALAITGVDLLNPCVVHVANTYTTGDIDWVYISGITGTTQLNGKFFIVHAAAAGTISLYDLFGDPVDATAFTAWVSGGTVQRVYTVASPYAAADLATVKFVQNTSVMIFAHNSYAPYQLTFVSPTNWTMAAITFGTTIVAPTAPSVATTLGAGTVNYAYVVTSVDADGQESEVSAIAALANKTDLRTVAGTNTVSWAAVDGAVSYNVYKSQVSYTNPVPTGQAYGFVGNVTGTSFIDSNVTADFSTGPPIARNPFATGSAVGSAVVTASGSYAAPTFPTVAFAAPGGSGVTALGYPLFGIITAVLSGGGGSSYAVGDLLYCQYGVVLTVATITGGGAAIATVTITVPGALTSATLNILQVQSTSGSGTGHPNFNVTWGVMSIVMTNGGSGYGGAPAVTFSSGAAAATAVMSALNGNPAVPCFFQQRLCLAGPALSPATMNFSRTGDYYNFNVTFPVQDDDAITASVVSGQLSNIKALVPQPGGLITLTDDVNFLINGGSPGAPITPANIAANDQSHVGCNDMPPIVVNFDILSVQSKGSSVRDSAYNFYANVYTGADISIISSHLFFGFQLQEWCWAEEPYKIVWAVRDDGALLSLTFIKEQEFTAWAHHFTEDGAAQFKSTATVVEPAAAGFQNFTYFVVQRSINSEVVQYIEYFPERATSELARDYWTVDCGVQYSGTAATSFTGGEFLVGKTCTGLADGLEITPFVMPASGNFTLAVAASKVTVGIAFVADLQTLYLDIGGAATIQSKMKHIASVTLRVAATLGLKIGSDDSNLVEMKDLVVGNVGSMSNERVTDLVTGDAMTVIDPKWQEKGQIFVRQSKPFPATVLGYIPSVGVGGMKG